MKKVMGLLLAAALLVMCGSAWADIKTSTTTATRDILLFDEEEPVVSKVKVEEMSKGDFTATLATDKEDSVYSSGEKIVLTFKSEKDAYLTILDFTPSGQIVVLFPNKWVENNFVKAGQEIKIPADGQKFAMKAGNTVGVDVVKAIATEKDVQIFNPENSQLAGPFSVLQDAKAGTRDILLFEEEFQSNNSGGEDPLKWTVASMALMTKGDGPSGFAAASGEGRSAKMWTNLTNYLTGENVFVKFLSDKPAKLVSLINLGASASENNLLPEGVDVTLAAGEILILPRKDDKWKLIASGKAGKDIVKGKLKFDDGTEMELALEVTVEEN
ncbi:MAG: DUF4384 domain-containing protein [Synergistaceae bacterium]|jgi:hypothetical protein|nr:DUF4384 domain-containing protein [Synergistaceae bacterium]